MSFLVGTLEPEAGQGNKMQTILDRTTLTKIGLVGESFMWWVVNSFGIIAIKPFSVSGQFQLYKGTATGHHTGNDIPVVTGGRIVARGPKTTIIL